MAKITPRDSSYHGDNRGAHVKFFGATPEKLALPGFSVKEVYMTVNHADTLRGLHFQVEPDQPKVLTCVEGKAVVNVVSLDPEDELFGQGQPFLLTGEAGPEGTAMIFVPAKHALGYRIITEGTKMLYLAGADFSPAGDVGIDPFDPELSLYWGPALSREQAHLSERDKHLPSFATYRASLGL